MFDATRRHNPNQLLYSGRYEPMKGAHDAVLVAVECLRRGLNVEMHCYGQGNLRDAMERTATGWNRIHIHDPIPYPELVQLSQSFDLFVCCHVQGDPCCTCLESFGTGLPIVGYANRMWRRLCATSLCAGEPDVGKGGGFCTAKLLRTRIPAPRGRNQGGGRVSEHV
jgi:colanic acid/amylovoran biosynthesis glycosyltransferase